MGEEPLSKDDPNYGTVDDPGFTDPYAHLRDKEKEQGTGETEQGEGDQPDASGTGGDQAGL